MGNDTSSDGMNIPKGIAGWRIALATAFSGIGTTLLPLCFSSSEEWLKVVPYLAPLLALLVTELLLWLFQAHFNIDPATVRLRSDLKKNMKDIRKQLKDKIISDDAKIILRQRYDAYALAYADNKPQNKPD